MFLTQWAGARLLTHCNDGCGLTIDRKADYKPCLTRPGFKFKLTTVAVPNDAVANNESKASAGAHGFRGKKRLEKVRLHIRRNARAVVHDFDDKLIVFEAGANADLSGSVDCVYGVVDQIGPNLVEFAPVSHDARQRAIEGASHRHVFQFVAEHD